MPRQPSRRRHLTRWLLAPVLLVALASVGFIHGHESGQRVPTASTAAPAVAVLGLKIAAKPSAAATCVVGQQCSVASVGWKHTVGCTRAWLKDMHLTTCPIDAKTGRPYPLVG